MINFDLNPEEQELLDSFERGEWISELTPERLKELQSYAGVILEEKHETDLQKLLIILKDGKWHSNDELTSKVSFHFGHTIIEARQKGYFIETRTVAKNKCEYRMQVVV